MSLAAQVLQEAEKLKASVSDTTTGSNEAWTSRQTLQDLYQRLLLIDLEYALDKKVEQDLWNHAFKNQINNLQVQAKDKLNPKRGEMQASLTLFLETASGFYLQLLQELCSAFQLDLPFRQKASKFGVLKEYGWGDSKLHAPKRSSCMYICQHCLVHLGDIARYQQQTEQAQTYYRHAAHLVPYNGQPYNQLAILEAAKGNKLATVFYYIRSVAVKHPFPAASTNLDKFYAKISKDCVEVKGKLSISEVISAFLQFHALIHLSLDVERAKKLEKSLTLSMPTHIASLSFSSLALVQMVAINLFTMYHARRHGSSSEKGDGKRDGKQEAVNTAKDSKDDAGFDMVLNFTVALFDHVLHLTPKQEAKAKEHHTLPALKTILDWFRTDQDILKKPVFISNLIWPNLCKLLNNLQYQPALNTVNLEKYATVPLSEDCDLQFFLPLQKAFRDLDFSRVPSEGMEFDLETRLRCQRIVEHGVWIADTYKTASFLNYQKLKNGKLQFTAAGPGSGTSTVQPKQDHVVILTEPKPEKKARQNVALQAIRQIHRAQNLEAAKSEKPLSELVIHKSEVSPSEKSAMRKPITIVTTTAHTAASTPKSIAQRAASTTTVTQILQPPKPSQMKTTTTVLSDSIPAPIPMPPAKVNVKDIVDMPTVQQMAPPNLLTQPPPSANQIGSFALPLRPGQMITPGMQLTRPANGPPPAFNPNIPPPGAPPVSISGPHATTMRPGATFPDSLDHPPPPFGSPLNGRAGITPPGHFQNFPPPPNLNQGGHFNLPHFSTPHSTSNSGIAGNRTSPVPNMASSIGLSGHIGGAGHLHDMSSLGGAAPAPRLIGMSPPQMQNVGLFGMNAPSPNFSKMPPFPSSFPPPPLPPQASPSPTHAPSPTPMNKQYMPRSTDFGGSAHAAGDLEQASALLQLLNPASFDSVSSGSSLFPNTSDLSFSSQDSEFMRMDRGNDLFPTPTTMHQVGTLISDDVGGISSFFTQNNFRKPSPDNAMPDLSALNIKPPADTYDDFSEGVPKPDSPIVRRSARSPLFRVADDFHGDTSAQYELFSQSPWSVQITSSKNEAKSHNSSPFDSECNSMRTTPDLYSGGSMTDVQDPAIVSAGLPLSSSPYPSSLPDRPDWGNRQRHDSMNDNLDKGAYLPNAIQSIWSAGPSPLEKLLEQQKQQRLGDPH